MNIINLIYLRNILKTHFCLLRQKCFLRIHSIETHEIGQLHIWRTGTVLRSPFTTSSLAQQFQKPFHRQLIAWGSWIAGALSCNKSILLRAFDWQKAGYFRYLTPFRRRHATWMVAVSEVCNWCSISHIYLYGFLMHFCAQDAFHKN